MLEGARSPVLGVLVSDLVEGDGDWSPETLRVLATGSAGRAMVGGPLEGREGLGRAVVMFRTWKGYQAAAFWPRERRVRGAEPRYARSQTQKTYRDRGVFVIKAVVSWKETTLSAVERK